MSSTRLEAFSDGVLAIIITIMVLELKTPEAHSLAGLWDDAGLGLLTYVLSFVYIGIYWSNHHHLFQVVRHVDGTVLWANLHLLFWLSLYPFTTRWMDESDLARTPTVVYGANLFLSAMGYSLLVAAIRRLPTSGHFDEVFGADYKGKASLLLYAAGIGLCFVQPWLGVIPFVVVALMWLIPDRRVERWLQEQEKMPRPGADA
jgi:uncharacterized membrane protein